MLPPDPVKHFLATGGEHINSEDVFIAVKMQGNQKQIGELETKKIRQTELQAQELAAQAIIQKHQVQTKGGWIPQSGFSEKLISWKLEGKPVKGRKQDLVAQWLALPNTPPAPIWTDEEENALQSLKESEVTVSQTKLGVKQNKLFIAAAQQVQHMSPGSISFLEQKIREKLTKDAAAANAAATAATATAAAETAAATEANAAANVETISL